MAREDEKDIKHHDEDPRGMTRPEDICHEDATVAKGI